MLISEDYRKQQQALHDSKKIVYGTVGESYGPTVSEMVDTLGIDSVLDYGAGRRKSLMKTFKPVRKVRYQAYDPGVPELAEAPEPAQLVVCLDVLEHIEPDLLENVLDHLEEVTKEVLFATVHCGPAGKILPDGRNAHLIQQPPEWWLPKFQERFHLQGFHARGNGFEVVCVNNHSGVGAID